MKDALSWLFAFPNHKWKTATTAVMLAWSASVYPAVHLYGALSDRSPPLPLHTQYAWMFLLAWAVCSIIVLQVFVNLTRLWDRVDVLERELASLRANPAKEPQ
jgi:hypothetical protein